MIIDNSKLTYKKNLKLNKAPFSVEESATKGNKRGKGNLSSLVPYISNAYNAFRKLPSPIKSKLESPINANLINLDAARNAIDVDKRVLNRETDYRVANPAVAQAIKGTVLGKAIQGRNELAQEEGNSNAQIKNQVNQFNQGIYARNIERENQFNRDTIQKDIAQQNLLSENLANVGDKYQEQSRDKSLMELENRKLSYLPEFYEKNQYGSSPYDRFKSRNPNTEKENYENGETVDKYAFGGEIDPSKSSKKSISKNDFIPISWKSQGVTDSTGRAPMYRTTNAALYGLNKAPIPQGVDPNAEVYPQIDSLDRKLGTTTIGKPIVSYARDIYGNIAPNDQGRVVSSFSNGGKLLIGDGSTEALRLQKERNNKRDSVRTVLINKYPKDFNKVNEGMLNYYQTEPEKYKSYNRKLKYGGGLSRSEDYGSKSHPYPSVSSSDFAGGHRSYPIPTMADAQDALRLAHLHGRSDVIAKVHSKYPSLKVLGGKIEEYGSGGTIHINPANKGKFNALKKRTGKSTEELTHSSNPLTRKRAIFAQNAKKWHH